MGADPTQIGILASIPMLSNLMQPIGAYFSERTTSRHIYCLWIYSISRSLWVGLAIAIFWLGKGPNAPVLLIALTLGIAFASSFIGAIGSAPWLSWMAALVPRTLRGRYFGLRNSATNLTNLISVPLMGLIISRWRGGSIQGYGIVLVLAIASGLISLWFQNFMVDINPQKSFYSSGKLISIEPNSIEPISTPTPTPIPTPAATPISTPISTPSDLTQAGLTNALPQPTLSLWQDSNFLKFLLYFHLWTFSVNLSAPFFNVYMLNNLGLNINHVTLYNSLAAGANLLMLMLWGKLADRIGNRPILLGAGIVFAVFPILWLCAGINFWSVWVWLPFLHCILGGAAAAIDLCSNNFQISIAPHRNQSIYFAVAAAVAGISGALGTTAGGFLAQFGYGGFLGLFALSSLLRLGALFPLIFVHERQAV
ncbi:MAG: MFS transporter [Leptolyngbyaceae cyanobacterium CSU_1_4]|nr:MFS transporter [Leptolyngbyaceae cyanobacterium CSU_1_4]